MDTLEKAIRKAIENGWFMDYSKAKDKWRQFKIQYTVEKDGIYSKEYNCMECYRPDYLLEEIIYDHEFAKALWPDMKRDDVGDYEKVLWAHEGYKTGDSFVPAYWDGPVWQYHLQQMVIKEDPIEYLKENT